ncbi:MAG TPA: hypothetical protein VGF73_01760 [Chthoniobacterales bacterium]
MERAAHLAGFDAQFLQKVFDLSEKGAGMFLENLAGGSEQDALAAALEEVDSQGSFEVAHLLGDVGLRDAEAVGGAAEAARLRDGEKVTKVPDLKGIMDHRHQIAERSGGWQRCRKVCRKILGSPSLIPLSVKLVIDLVDPRYLHRAIRNASA